LHPLRGMRIPIEFYFHDNDNGAWEGNLAWSPFNTDQAWQSPTQWSFTWIGDTTDIVTNAIDVADGNILKSYRLEQNYPNPFNPTTRIEYTIPHGGQVSLQVYNMLGQRYSITWDAKDLPSGVYFYRIQAGVFNLTKKMLLVK